MTGPPRVLLLLLLMTTILLECASAGKKKKPCNYNGKKYKAGKVIATIEDNCVSLICSRKGKKVELELIKNCNCCDIEPTTTPTTEGITEIGCDNDGDTNDSQLSIGGKTNEECPNPCFVNKHVCKDCSDINPSQNSTEALEFVKKHRTNLYTSKGWLKFSHVFSERYNKLSYEKDQYKGDNGWEPACHTTNYVPTWLCNVKWEENEGNWEGKWEYCKFEYYCISVSALDNGHLWPKSVQCVNGKK